MSRISDNSANVERDRRELLIENWERRTAIPLAFLAVLFLALWAVQVLVTLGPIGFDLVEGAILLIWVAFIVDFVFRFSFHKDKRAFLRANIIEIIAIIVPAFRFLRVLRIVMAIGLLTRVVQSLQGRVNLYVAIVLPLLTFAGALGVFEAERFDPRANITNFGDALWWAAVTIFTVGYGDRYPVTWEGRSIAVVLMLGGVAMLSVITANLASFFLSQQRQNGNGHGAK